MSSTALEMVRQLNVALYKWIIAKARLIVIVQDKTQNGMGARPPAAWVIIVLPF